MELDGVHFKVQADTSQLPAAEQAVDDFGNASEEAQKQVEELGAEAGKSAKKIDRYQIDAKRASDTTKTLGKEVKETGSRSKKTASSVAILSSEFSELSGHVKTAAISTGAMAATLGTWSVSIANSVKEQQAWADATGVSLQTMQEWSAAAGAIGKDAGFIGDVFKDANEKIGDFVATGGGEAKDVFEQLNIQASELKNLSPDQQLLLIARRLEGVATQGEKLFILESLANDASLLLPLLEDNASGLEKVTKQAREMGVVISDADAAKLREVSSEWTMLTQAIEGMGNTLATEYADDVASFLGASSDAISSLTGFISENSEAIKTSAIVIAGSASAYGAASAALLLYSSRVKIATAVTAAFNAAITANPIGLLVRGLALVAGGTAAYIASMDSASDANDRNRATVEELADAYDGMTLSQLEAELARLTVELGKTTIKQVEAAESIREQSNAAASNIGLLGGMATGLAEASKRSVETSATQTALESAIAGVKAAIEGLNNENARGRPIISGSTSATKKQVATYRELLGAFDETQAAYNRYYDVVEKISASASTNAQKTELMEFAYRALQQELSGTGESYRELLGMFDDGQAAYNDYYDTVQRIADANIDAAQKTDLMAAAFRRLQEQKKEAYSLDSAPDVGESMGGLFGQFAQLDEAEASVNQWYENQIDKLNEFRALKAERTAEWDEMEAEAYRTQQDKLNQIDMARKDLQLATAESAFGSVAETMRTAFGEQSGIYKIAFAAEKAFAIARSIVAIQAGIAQAASLPFPANLAAMATVAANTASIVANIQSVAMVGQAHDGIDSVPREGTWLLDKGERVVDRRTNEDLKDFLANGGSVNNNSSSVNQNIYVTGTVDRRTSAQIAQDAARKQRVANARFGQR